MNWFDKRPGHRLLALFGALIALAGAALCPALAHAEGEKDQKQEETGKKKDPKKDKKKQDKKKDKKAQDDEKSDKKKKKRKGKDKDEKEVNDGDIPVPIGYNWEGVKIPQNDENGRPQMVFEIGTAFRVDERHLKMEDLKIETFDALGNVEMVIDMPKSVMDIQTRIITSADPVSIVRSDFKITGGNATFDSRIRYGTFKGPVKMLIYNRDF